jgi:ankyrin repeat protein
MKVDNVEVMKLLLENGADVNARGSDGKTALMHHITTLERAKLLLERGADANARDNG